jgi:simple sugar transport system permease protein
MSATLERLVPPGQRRRRWTPRSFAITWSSQIGITAALLLVWIIFTILAPNTFLHGRIYVSYAQTVPYFGLMSLPLTMLVVTGDIDLSFASVFALGMTGYIGVEHATHDVTLGLIAAIAVGAAAGLVNGFFVTVLGIPSLVVTIGTWYLYRGLTLVLVDGRSYTLLESQKAVVGRLLVGRWLGVPMQFVWFVILGVITWLLMYRHRLGQNAHVVGDNKQAAGLMGIPITRTRVILFVFTGMVSAFAGAMNSFQVLNFYPSQGDGYLLPALAAIFVGGTSVFGGRGTIWGTFIGAFLIGGIEAGIVAVGMKDFYTEVIYGGIIIAAVTIHALLRRRFAR